ncbi:unnamed protein product [Gongylonema pulchrum]|uniref:Flocculation protein FLO11-like n=1 Tax=Gongylonema pulchrum TaxID=637853 RepID=A0A183EDJ8_9BILA|nr:unnamed protein product [Gongylonema pulchrum]
MQVGLNSEKRSTAGSDDKLVLPSPMQISAISTTSFASSMHISEASSVASSKRMSVVETAEIEDVIEKRSTAGSDDKLVLPSPMQISAISTTSFASSMHISEASSVASSKRISSSEEEKTDKDISVHSANVTSSGSSSYSAVPNVGDSSVVVLLNDTAEGDQAGDREDTRKIHTASNASLDDEVQIVDVVPLQPSVSQGRPAKKVTDKENFRLRFSKNVNVASKAENFGELPAAQFDVQLFEILLFQKISDFNIILYITINSFIIKLLLKA